MNHFFFILVTKINKEKECWQSDLERSLSIAMPLSGTVADNNRVANTPVESSHISPMIAASGYHRTTVLMSSKTVVLTDKPEPTVAMSDGASTPRSTEIKCNQFDSNFSNYIQQPLYTGELHNRISPYADQVRRSMSPPLYIEDYGRSTYPTALNASPAPIPYYFFYRYAETPIYNQEQEMPLDLSVHH